VLILNGAAAVSLLTFIGNHGKSNESLVASMMLFAFGALMAPLAFTFAYLAQLSYGNDSLEQSRAYRIATLCHFATYGFALLGAVLFVCGVVWAGRGFTVPTSPN
jgi:hypothetical protein